RTALPCRLAGRESESGRRPLVGAPQFRRREPERPRGPTLPAGSGQADLGPIQRPRSVPWRIAEVSARHVGAGLVADFDLLAPEVASGRAGCPDMNAERMVHYDWRRHSPHRETRVVGDGLDRDRKRAFLVDKAFGFVLRKHERPRMLAYLVRSIEGEFRRFVGVFGVLGKLASRHDEAVESC